MYWLILTIIPERSMLTQAQLRYIKGCISDFNLFLY